MTTTSENDINIYAYTHETAGESSEISGADSCIDNGPTHSRKISTSQNSTQKQPNSNRNYSNSNVPGSNSNEINIPSDAGNPKSSDNAKRKKFKSRNATVPSYNYSKYHLDAWLDTCLKDASNAQLSSSSEFLDFNPTNKQQPQWKHQHSITTNQQQPQSSVLNTQQFQAIQQQHQQQVKPQKSNNRHNFQRSTINFNAPFTHGIHRNMSNYLKQSNTLNNRFSSIAPSGTSYYPHNEGSQDFASLPPIVNFFGGIGASEPDNHSTHMLEGNENNPNISHGFRFSDPCLLNPSDIDSKITEQKSPDVRNSEIENNKFFAALMQQINILHETNSKICRNLHETKVDIEALKHTPSWGGMRHRRDSLSGLSTHSQPLVFGPGFGRQSPAPTFLSGAYTPGMMTDVVREVKEAARVREDALLNRVRALVEERQWSTNEANLRIMHDIEDLKCKVQHLRLERKESNKRVTHLEAENKYMRQLLASIYNNRNVPGIIYENDTLRTSKTTPNIRRTQSFNLQYGTIHQQPTSSEHPSENERDGALQIRATPSSTSDNTFPIIVNCGERSILDSADSTTAISNGKNTSEIQSPPNFALVSPPIESQKRNEKQYSSKESISNEDYVKKAENRTLRRELHDAVAARKKADQRIIALETLVRNLSAVHPADSACNIITNGLGGGYLNGSSTNSNLTSEKDFKWDTATTPTLDSKKLQSSSNNSHVSHSSSKLSVAGPITDL